MNGDPRDRLRGVRSVSRVLDILEYLSQNPTGESLTEISNALSIPVSSCHELLVTLLDRGYLVKHPRTNRYRMSSRISRLAFSQLSDLGLVERADAVMDAMFRLCGNNISLAILDEGEVVIIHKKTSQGADRIVNPIGTRLPAHATSLGKVILAQWPAEKINAWLADNVLARFTENTITSPDAFLDHLETVRKRNLAFDNEESAHGVFAAGSCIFNSLNMPVASMSILSSNDRESDPAYWNFLMEFIRIGANTVSMGLGCSKVDGEAGFEILRDLWGAHSQQT